MSTRVLLVISCLASFACIGLGCGSSAGVAPSTATDVGSSCHPKVGDKAPEIEAKSIQGAQKVVVTPGKVTLVDFWATWCAPCGEAFPHYQDLYVKYKSSGLDVVAVNVDEDKTPIDTFLRKAKNPTFTIGWDSKQSTASCWGPDPMPTMFVVDKKGIVRKVHKGWHAGDEKELERFVKTLL